jgi:LPXTG-motif cell wall-anchored protein
MSLTRRLAAGLPAAGVTFIAALALSGSPAAATGDEPAAGAKQPAVMTTTDAADAPAADAPAADAPAAEAPAAAGDAAVAPARGNDGYGPTPTTTVYTVPPTGVANETSPPAVTPSQPTGVSAGTLPLTGAPMGLTMAIGGMLVAGGSAAVYYTRRRRSA